MKKLLAFVLASIGLAGGAHAQPKPQTVDPKAILFSVPTLSNDIAPLVPVEGRPGEGDLIFHEDEWSQIEFLPRSHLDEVKRMLKEFKAFEQANRVQHGWRNVYVRKLDRTAVLPSPQGLQQLETLLGAKAGGAPILVQSPGVGGRVQSGFTLALGGKVTLYGQFVGGQIKLLGAYLGEGAKDFKLTEAFMKLNAGSGVILVDWRRQLILLSTTPAGQLDIWQP